MAKRGIITLPNPRQNKKQTKKRFVPEHPPLHLGRFFPRNLDLEEKNIAKLLVGEYILPFQIAYIQPVDKYAVWIMEKEKGLWGTSFLRGIEEATMIAKSVRQKRIKEFNIEWVKSEEGLMSFNWYCSCFNIHAERARAKILHDAALASAKESPDLSKRKSPLSLK